MSPATDTTLVSSIILPTYKRPLEAPWPPAVGPIETLHLCAVRLSCLEKVGSAMVTLRASQGQTEARKPITATNEGLPFQTCLYLRSDCSAVVTLSATAAEDVILGLFIRGVGGGNGKMRLEGKRHIFSRSDGVVRLWPSRGEEYAAHTLRASGQGVGSFPD